MDDYYPLEVFSPDETLDSGAGYAVAQRRQCEPERKLLAAVLKDALSTFKKRSSTRDARFEETERWIFGEDTDRLFAFKTLCAMLGLSAERIRRDLRDSAAGIGVAPGFNCPRRARAVRSIERATRTGTIAAKP